MGDRILVTGAGGFIGSRVVDQLVSDGMHVRCLGHRPLSRTQVASCDAVIGDIRDPAVVTRATKDVDVVFHFAAAVHRKAREDEYWSINVEATRNLAIAAAANGVRKFVFASSTSVYGKGDIRFTEDSPCKPDSAYGKSKLMAESVLKDVAAETNMSLTILRLSTVYGEGEPGNVSRLIKAVAKYGPVVLGPGTNRKSMTYVGNVAALCSRLAKRQHPSAGRVSVLNVADPTSYRLMDIVAAIASALNKPGRIVKVDRRVALLGSWCISALAGVFGRKSPLTVEQVVKITENAECDVTKLQRELGFVAPVLLDEGIRRTVGWYRAMGEI